MRKRITLALLCCLLVIALASCNNAPKTNIGEIRRIEFKSPGVFNYMDGNTYALVNYEYNPGEYKVYAYYSTGYQEDITSSVEISTTNSDIVKINGKKIKFSDDEVDGVYTEYPITVKYGNFTENTVVNAVRAGDAIGGLKVKQTKFFVGSKLTSSIAGITYISDSGSFTSTTFLPSSGYVWLFDKDEKLKDFNTLKDSAELKQEGGYKVYYHTYWDSNWEEIDITVIPLTDVKSLNVLSIPLSPKSGETYTASEFNKTYLKGLKAYLYNEDKSAKLLDTVVDENGDVKSGYTINVSVTDKTGTTVRQSGDKFQTGDRVLVTVTYNSVSGQRGTYVR